MASLWETLIHPDREELEFQERSVVCRAANLLQVGEFQLLQLAYREWFGADLPEALVSRLFTTYMLNNEVPHWARHYARAIVDNAERGIVDDQNPAYHRYDYEYHTTVPRGVQRFWAAVTVLAGVVLGSVIFADAVVRKPTSILPPYFEEDELRPRPAADSSDRRTPNLNWGRSDSIPAGAGLQRDPRG